MHTEATRTAPTTFETHDGLRLSVREHGPADAPLTVALPHSWTADSDNWHYQVRDLLTRFGHQVRVLTWDHRGHGHSDTCPRAACTIDNLARDMAGLLDARVPEGPLVVAGHSMGGMTLMALGEQRPDLVARVRGAAFIATAAAGLDQVTLGLPEIGPALKNRIPRVLALRARMLSRRARRRTPILERQVVRRFLFGDPLRPRDTGLVVDQVISCPPATMEGFFAACLAHDRTAALPAWDGVPTRVLVGTRDLLTPPSYARAIASGIGSARLLLAPGAGHELPLERDELVSGELIALVESALRPGLTAAPAP